MVLSFRLSTVGVSVGNEVENKNKRLLNYKGNQAKRLVHRILTSQLNWGKKWSGGGVKSA